VANTTAYINQQNRSKIEEKSAIMTLDFTLNKYRELCHVISCSDYTQLTLEEYFSLKKVPEKFIILRHDVDDEPEYALKMARMENELNIKSTYYFRNTEKVFKQDIIREIKDLRHEIGYHYEILDEASGNYAYAIEIFKKNLSKFRDIYDIKTIAQHGSPLIGELNATSLTGIYDIAKNLLLGTKVFTTRVNANIWKEYDFKNFGIKGEAYISINFDDVIYLSDTGMSWNNKYRMKDLINPTSASSNTDLKVKSTSDIINLIKSYKANHIYLLIHADQWRDNLPDWIKWSILKYVRNNGKRCLKWIIQI
jgi:hypothetical protein